MNSMDKYENCKKCKIKMNTAIIDECPICNPKDVPEPAFKNDARRWLIEYSSDRHISSSGFLAGENEYHGGYTE